jgi:carbon starvation protein CstA
MQSPIIARTIRNEKDGRKIFYGMMIVEGVIAMIWAAAAMSLMNGEDLSVLLK